MAYTKTTWIDKAVQFAKRYYMNGDGGNDKNLLPPLSDYTKHANFTINSDYNGTLTASSTFQTSSIEVPCIPSTQYTLSVTTSSGIGYAEIGWLDSANTFTSLANTTGASGSLTRTITTPSNAVKLKVLLSNTATGTFTFSNMQLELGSSATSFAPKKMYTIVPSGGTVTAAGTPVNAANLNKLEQGVQDAHTTADAALPKAGGTMTGTLVVPAITLNGTGLAQTRLNSGQLEFWDGGAWKKVAGYGSGKYKGTFNTTSSTAVTALSVTGMGALKFLRGSGTGGTATYANIIIDGTTIHSALLICAIDGTATVNGLGINSSTTPLEFDVSFSTSLQIQIYRSAGSGTSTVDWLYELV